MKKILLSLSLASLCFCTAAGNSAEAFQTLNLPRMGEPADQVMSPRDEKAIGRRFMRQIREHLPLVEDTELAEYVQKLGRKLVASQPGIDATDFNFFVVENEEINAFAIPGGFVGINSGLITSAKNEAQLASVIAHEIAHGLQRHIARLYASQGNTGLKTAATIIAAIILSQQSAQAGQAALLTGLAASQQSRINFTRLHEYEADRLGIQLLANAGYNPDGMTDFFEVLRRRIALNTTEQMEFLRTHPLTTNRISEARNNAARLGNPIAVEDSMDFQMQQVKLEVLHTSNPANLERALRAGHITDSKIVELYGRILLNLKQGKPEVNPPLVTQMLKIQPENSSARMLAARVAASNGQNARAERLLGELIAIHPDNYAATESLIDLLVHQGRAARAQHVIKTYIRHTTQPDPAVYRKYASVLRMKGSISASHEALADHFFLLDEDTEALGQLELALRSAIQDSNEEYRLAARIQEVREKARF